MISHRNNLNRHKGKCAEENPTKPTHDYDECGQAFPFPSKLKRHKETHNKTLQVMENHHVRKLTSDQNKSGKRKQVDFIPCFVPSNISTSYIADSDHVPSTSSCIADNHHVPSTSYIEDDNDVMSTSQLHNIIDDSTCDTTTKKYSQLFKAKQKRLERKTSQIKECLEKFAHVKSMKFFVIRLT